MISDLQKLTLKTANNKRTVPKRKTGMQTQNIKPSSNAFSLQNRNRSIVHREAATEILGSFSAGPNTIAGEVLNFPLNPMSYKGTRLHALASTYQKFRFTKARLYLYGSMVNQLGGLLTMGFTNDPLVDIPTSQFAYQQVFAYDGAKMQDLQQPLFCDAKFLGKESYTLSTLVDLLTTQGTFLLTAVQAFSTLTSALQIPILLEYEIEFSGLGNLGPPANDVFIWPAVSVEPIPGDVNSVKLTPLPGEPAWPATNYNALWEFVPEFSMSFDVNGNIETISKVLYSQANGHNSFFATQQDWINKTPIQNLRAQQIPRCTMERYELN